MLRQLFVDAFSFCSQIPVLLVFYQCEQKMTSAVKGSKQAWILDPRRIHQQSYPQEVDELFAFGQQQQVTWCEGGLAESAEA
jgi:hypothetical protein